jgi:Endosomal/lysosomal potassium channel TMEM175
MESSRRDDQKETGRVESFSDGVIAIAITLLILEIKVPKADEIASVSLFARLLDLWPSFSSGITTGRMATSSRQPSRDVKRRRNQCHIPHHISPTPAATNAKPQTIRRLSSGHHPLQFQRQRHPAPNTIAPPNSANGPKTSQCFG